MVDLEEIRRYLVKSLSRYRDHSEYEDGFQEAMIRAWKDVEAGNTEFLHVAHRARQWAFNFYKDVGVGRRHHTGAPKLTNAGRRDARGEQSRSKIQQFVDQYYNLHRQEPTNKQVSQGTGLAVGVVSYHRKNMREGKGINHAMYTEQYGEKRMDYAAYKQSHITSDNEDFIYSFNRVQFEDSVIDELDFYRTLEKIEPFHRNVLYWHHVMGYNAKEISKLLGLEGGSTSGSRRLRMAHDAVLAALYPDKYPEVCRNGHHRTSDNTLVYEGATGIRKVCTDCSSETKKRQSARRKQTKGRVLKTHCKNNHEIRGYKSGRRYCKVCNYLSRYPGKTDTDISQDSKLWNWDERP